LAQQHHKLLTLLLRLRLLFFKIFARISYRLDQILHEAVLCTTQKDASHTATNHGKKAKPIADTMLLYFLVSLKYVLHPSLGRPRSILEYQFLPVIILQTGKPTER
jgi:hypothetical protein